MLHQRKSYTEKQVFKSIFYTAETKYFSRFLQM